MATDAGETLAAAAGLRHSGGGTQHDGEELGAGDAELFGDAFEDGPGHPRPLAEVAPGLPADTEPPTGAGQAGRLQYEGKLLLEDADCKAYVLEGRLWPAWA